MNIDLFLLCRTGQGSNHQITKEVGLAVCEALVDYNNEDYSAAVEKIWPLRCHLVNIGGSDAQVM